MTKNEVAFTDRTVIINQVCAFAHSNQEVIELSLSREDSFHLYSMCVSNFF